MEKYEYSGRIIKKHEEWKEICDIPVFNDDQHGTAIVVAAAVAEVARKSGVARI